MSHANRRQKTNQIINIWLKGRSCNTIYFSQALLNPKFSLLCQKHDMLDCNKNKWFVIERAAGKGSSPPVCVGTVKSCRNGWMDIEKEIGKAPSHGICCNGHLWNTWKTSVGPIVDCYQCLRSSRKLAVRRSLPLAPSSHSVSPTHRGAQSRNRSPSLLLAGLLGTVGPMCQHSTSRALETTLSLQGGGLLFCLTPTGRMNNPLLPPALLGSPGQWGRPRSLWLHPS